MRPALFSFVLPGLGNVVFPAYMTCLLLGLVLAAIWTVRRAPKEGLAPVRILDINLIAIGLGLLGARLLHVIADGHFHDYVNLCTHPERVVATEALVRSCWTAKECGFGYVCDAAQHVCHPPRDCFAWLKFWHSGLAYYGGFLLATPAIWLYTRRYKLSFWKVADLAAPAIAFGLFLGRIGCFLAGCCYGKETALPWGIRFPLESLPWQAQYKQRFIQAGQAMHPIHPTQLYEAVGALLLALVLFFVVRPRKQRQGQVIGGLLLGYGVLRFVCEFFRDDERGVFFSGWISTSQLISIPLVLLGVYLCWMRREKPPAHV